LIYIPITTSRTFFHTSSVFVSWHNVIPIRRWIPWWRINRPEHGISSEWSTVTGAYLKNFIEKKRENIEKLTYSPLGDNSNISYQTRRSWITWTWFVSFKLTPVIGLNVWAGIGFEKGIVTGGERVFIVLN